MTITLNHFTWLCARLGMKGFHIPTLTQYGYSSAAEIFYLMSGYMVGLVYLKKEGASQKLLSRVWLLYKTNLAAFVIVLSILWFSQAQLATASYFNDTVNNPLYGITMFLALLQAPFTLDVLQVYIILMLATALLLPLIRTAPVWLMAGSVLLYIATQFFPWLNLPGGPMEGDRLWNINPFSFQILFFGGMLAGKHALHKKLFYWFGNSLPKAVVVILLLLAVVVFYRLDVMGLRNTVWSQKTSLGVVRLVHMAIVISALVCIVNLTRKVHHTLPFQLLSMVGRQSLNCFSASIIATYLGASVWLTLGGSWLNYIWLSGVTIIAIFIVAMIRENGWAPMNWLPIITRGSEKSRP